MIIKSGCGVSNSKSGRTDECFVWQISTDVKKGIIDKNNPQSQVIFHLVTRRGRDRLQIDCLLLNLYAQLIAASARVIVAGRWWALQCVFPPRQSMMIETPEHLTLFSCCVYLFWLNRCILPPISHERAQRGTALFLHDSLFSQQIGNSNASSISLLELFFGQIKADKSGQSGESP